MRRNDKYFGVCKNTSQDGLDVTLTTNKDKYSQGEEIVVVLKVKNTNDYAVNKLLFWSKDKDIDTLENYAKNHSLISYEIYGDVVSALGEHSGQIKSYYPFSEARINHAGKHGSGRLQNFLASMSEIALGVITGKDIAQYYERYNVQSIMEYFWVTHETDSFFYYLTQGERGG